MSPTINFIVIGAAKSGTTSLFHYLNAHPQIQMPAEKEVDYFSSPTRLRLGLEWYLAHWPESANNKSLCGEASPQYMQSSLAPELIHKHLGSIKLIALLRNPIDRAFSHFRHAVRRQAEQRTFDTVVQELANGHRCEYFAHGLYGEILSNYLVFLPRQSIKLLFTDDLERDPHGTMQSLYEWLGVDASFTNKSFGMVYNSGRGTLSQKTFETLQGVLLQFRRRTGFKRSVESLLPAMLRATYRTLRVKMMAVPVVTRDAATIDPQIRILLREYFADDLRLLEEKFDVTVPWQEFHESKLFRAA